MPGYHGYWVVEARDVLATFGLFETRDDAEESTRMAGGKLHRMKEMPTAIDRAEVQRLVAEEAAQLVEVLPAREFAEEHITGAVNIPLKELDERAPHELNRDRPVIVYCNDYQ